MLSWIKKIFLIFILGALTFTPWDILLVRFEIVEYQHPAWIGIASWTPLAFGIATSFGVLLFIGLEKVFPGQQGFEPSHLVYEYFLLAAFYIGILFFHTSPYLLSLSLFLMILTRLLFFHRRWDFIYFMLGACIGPTVEMILIQFNLYRFTEPDFLGMPYWLPLFWGEVTIALRRVGWVFEPQKGSPPTKNFPFGNL